MADLSVHAYRWCASNEHDEIEVEGSTGTYTVTYGKTPHGPYQYDWSCTCKGFKFRGTCKHIAKAKGQHCGYGHDAVCGSPAEMGDTCPSCGGETSVVRVGV